MNKYDFEVLKYAKSGYGFLMPKLQFTCKELANAIAEYYSLENPQNAEVHRVLMKYGKEII